MKKLFLVLAIGCLLFLAQSQFLRAQDITEESTLIDVGNKICPVSGEKIDEKTKATYEYEGKIYNFCCPVCIDEFKKDPEKYIKKVEEELRAEAQEEEKHEDHSDHPH